MIHPASKYSHPPVSPQENLTELNKKFLRQRLLCWQELSDSEKSANNTLQQIYTDLSILSLNLSGESLSFSPEQLKPIKIIFKKAFENNQKKDDLVFWGSALGEIQKINDELAEGIFEENKMLFLGVIAKVLQEENPLTLEYFRGLQPKWIAGILKQRNLNTFQIMDALVEKINLELENNIFPKLLAKDFIFVLNFLQQINTPEFADKAQKYLRPIEAAFEAFVLDPDPQMALDLRKIADGLKNLTVAYYNPNLLEKIQAALPHFDLYEREMLAEARQNFSNYFPKLKLNSPPRTDISEIMQPPKNNGDLIDFTRQICQYCLFNFSQTKSDLQQLLDFLDSARAGQLMISNNKNLAIDISNLLKNVAESDKHHLFSGAEFQKFWQDLLSVLVSKKFFSNCSAADFENILKYFKHCQIKSPIDSQETEKQTLQIFTEEAQNMLRRGDENSFSILFNALLENWKTILPNFCTQMKNFLENPNPKNLIQVSPEVRKFAQEKIKLLNPLKKT